MTKEQNASTAGLLDFALANVTEKEYAWQQILSGLTLKGDKYEDYSNIRANKELAG